jgi:DNA-binding NarL/FixJ family response regulator
VKKAPLSETDQEILYLLSEGATDGQAARVLGIGHRTVQRRVTAMMAKLGVVGRVALGARAAQAGLLQGGPQSAGLSRENDHHRTRPPRRPLG